MVMTQNLRWKPIIQRWETLDSLFKAEMWVVRDDLLPFPLAGNKVRKIEAEINSLPSDIDALITNGGVDSNYCRTLAFFAAQRSIRVHFSLHSEEDNPDKLSLKMLQALGATFDVGPAETISSRILATKVELEGLGMKVHVLSGGGHSRPGAVAFKEAGRVVFESNNFDQVFVASGTGATQGGLVAAAEEFSTFTEIVGISVARNESRGISPVKEAAIWANSKTPHVTFNDQYRAGGYGKTDEQTIEACTTAWMFGLPVDPTYTGKAFAGMLDYSRTQSLGSKVLFWHTGGLMNWLTRE